MIKGDLFIGEPAVKQNGNARTLIPYLDKALELEVSVQLKEGKFGGGESGIIQ